MDVEQLEQSSLLPRNLLISAENARFTRMPPPLPRKFLSIRAKNLHFFMYILALFNPITIGYASSSTLCGHIFRVGTPKKTCFYWVCSNRHTNKAPFNFFRFWPKKNKRSVVFDLLISNSVSKQQIITRNKSCKFASSAEAAHWVMN